MGLRWPLSSLSFTFTWDDRETEDHAKASTSSLFEGLLINNTELWDIFVKPQIQDVTGQRQIYTYASEALTYRTSGMTFPL